MNDRDFADACVWIANSPVLSIDTETTGLHPYEYDVILGISVANETKAIYFPLRHPGSHNLSYDQGRNLMELLSQPRERILFHNAIFDWPTLRNDGWVYPDPWATTWDTMVCAWLLDENEPKKLEEQVSLWIDPTRAKEQKERQKKVKKIGWENTTFAQMQSYATWDARNTFDLYLIQREKISQHADLACALEREMRFLQVCDEMIANGVRVDVAQAQRKLRECDIGIEKLEIEYPGLNFDSPQQIGQLVFSDEGYEDLPGWGIVPTTFTRTGQPATDKDTLLRYLEYEPRINDIFDYRKLRKARSTYYVPLVERQGRDGRVHAWYRPHGTKPGRMSCLARDSLVRTSQGEKKIQDIRPGDLVYTHENRWRPVLRQWRVGAEPVFDVHLSNGEVMTCTSSHRLLTLEGWRTVDECQQALGQRSEEPGEGSCAVPRYSFVVAGGSRERTWYDDAQRASRSEDADVASRERCSQFLAEIGWEAGIEESDEGQDRKQTSSLEGRMSGWAWVSNLSSRRETAVRASSRDGKGIRSEDAPSSVRRSSHQRGSDGQPPRQSRSGNARRSSNYPLLTGEGQCVVGIEAIYPRGSAEVYDLTVEEDESYFSGGVFSHNCSDPNLQTLPHEETLPGIKDCFLAADGFALCEYDLSQAELRVAAYYSDDDVLRAHLAEGDVHAATAVAMFGDSDDTHRSVAKNLNFGALYGIGAAKFVKTARRKGDRTITEDIARQHLGQWRNLYAGVTQAFKDAEAIAIERPIRLWPVGRYRRFNTAHGRFDHPKDAFNSIVQGGVGEYVKQLMMELREPAAAAGVRIVLNVHDSVVTEVPLGMEEQWTRTVRQVAARCNPFRIDMPVGVKQWSS